MKFVLLLFLGFLFIAMLLNGSRKRGMLNEDANKAVTGLATAMRYFLYGLLVLGAAACAVLIYQGS
ncbi:hypothetical protein G4G28_10820 [Massilia sp. Dwa41.01b]|uniref:hypothetical protein n=1 Tax=unclassified Massilia TaxID=2609279 RepID=UPI00160365DA|nr:MULTISPECIES: hypothetical protein [unclassified Massilia]QNA88853.1 hypothetical protein G4G28_10820 [Massilia sp. Dwa41.01b]QNA99744.1 hypothetical protein G4G31_14455 [Massilia sp. Se16.2.3]